jgi:hypothetical protein
VGGTGSGEGVVLGLFSAAVFNTIFNIAVDRTMPAQILETDAASPLQKFVEFAGRLISLEEDGHLSTQRTGWNSL